MPATLALWNFNSPSPDGNPATGTTTAAVGSGTLAAIGGVSTSFVSGAGSTDPAPADDSALNLTMFPGQGTANKTAGVQLVVNAAGYGGVVLTFDQRNTPPGAGSEVVQVSTNGGGTWTDAATLTTPTPNAWVNARTVNLSAVPGVDNNPNLRVRIVAAFAGGTYPGTGAGYTPTGAWALDAIKVEATLLPVVTVEKIADAVEGGTAGTFQFARTGSTSSALTVSYTVAGTATSGTDYTALTGTVTFTAGSATADVTVTTIDDAGYDPAETVAVAVASGTGYAVGSPASATVLITDDEGTDLQVTVSDGTSSYTPGDVLTYTLTVTNAGPEAVTGATILDAFAPTFTSVSWTATATGGATGFSTSGTSDIDDTVSMPVGSTITYTVAGQTSSAATTALVNAAVVSVPAGTSDLDPTNNTAVDIDEVTLTGTGVIGGNVFQDWGASGDGNGVRDSGEDGYEGGTVSLLDQYGTVIQQTTTDGDGDYSFTGLWAGTFTVQFALPFGWDFTLQEQGSDPTIDSDVDPLTGTSGPITLATSSSTATTVGAGFTRPEPTTVPTVVYAATYDWNGVATVTTTVTLNAPGYEGLYLWSYHVVNESFSEGIANFAVPVQDSTMVSNLTSSVSWDGSIGTFLDDESIISWNAGSAPTLVNEDSADFSFTTIPTHIGLTNGIVASVGLTVSAGDFVATALKPSAVPVPVPKSALLVATKADNDPLDRRLSLRAAITKINSSTVPEKLIEFTDGLKNQTITLGSLNELTIRKQMTIDGTNQKITITRDVAEGDFPLFEVNSKTTFELKNMTLTGGGGAKVPSGGAIRSEGDLILSNCVIRDNEVGGAGGAILASSGTVTITNCEIANNRVLDDTLGRGAGIAILGGVTKATISKSTIHNNFGGATGGGIYLAGGDGTIKTLLVLEDTQIYRNGVHVAGGGVFVDVGQSPIISMDGDTIIASNGALGKDSKGGGVYLGSGVLGTQSATLAGNLAADGGGLYIVDGAEWQLPFNADFLGNHLDDVNGGEP